MTNEDLKTSVCHAALVFYLGLMILLSSSDIPCKKVQQIIGQMICSLACGMLGYLMTAARHVAPDVERDLPEKENDESECACESTEDVPQPEEQCLTSPVERPTTADERIVALGRQKRQLRATFEEDRKEEDAAFFRGNEGYNMYFRMDSENRVRPQAQQAWEIASKRYSDLKKQKEEKLQKWRKNRIRYCSAEREPTRVTVVKSFLPSDMDSLDASNVRCLRPKTSIPNTTENNLPKPDVYSAASMAVNETSFWDRTFVDETIPIMLQKSTIIITFGILLLTAIPLFLSALLVIITTPGTTKKMLSAFVSAAMAGLPLGLSIIMTGLGAPFKVVVLNVALICSVDLYHLTTTDVGMETVESVQEERNSEADRLARSTAASRLAAQNLRKMVFGHLSKEKEAADPPAPTKTSILQETASVAIDEQNDISDDASTILTPPPSESEDEATCILHDLEAARQEKIDLEAAESDEEYMVRPARLNMEEAEHQYNNTAKWSDQRETHFLALERCRRAYRVLVYLKEQKMFTMKKLALEIEYLEKKSKRESTEDTTEETNEDDIAETK